MDEYYEALILQFRAQLSKIYRECPDTDVGIPADQPTTFLIIEEYDKIFNIRKETKGKIK